MTRKKIISMVVAFCVVALAFILFFALTKEPSYRAIPYETYGFANMRGYEGTVYRGIGGAYGQDIPVEASTFSIKDDYIYYAEQIKEDYVVSDERFGSIMKASLSNPSDSIVLVKDAYNLGYGQEKLIGDKIFYTTGYDEDYNYMYAWVDVNDLSTGSISSSRINNIFGFDGTCIFYSGYDKKTSKNIVGSYNISTGKDKTLYSYSDVGEIGSVIGISYSNGSIYAVTMTKQPENYDDRTAEYNIEVRETKKGKVSSTLPFILTGAANYGFLFDGDTLYYSTAESICKINLLTESEGTTLCSLKELEYWGIPHFVPKDGYLYYEALADIDFDTGLNDYFYKVDLNGGEPELLTAWFTN